MAMNSRKCESLLRGQTNVAQKVYQAVPAQCAWGYDEIQREVRRLGFFVDYNVMQGCLNALCNAGLVRESPKGKHFVRTEVRGVTEKSPPASWDDVEEAVDNVIAIETTKVIDMATPSTLQMVPTTISPIDQLTKLSARALTLAGQMKMLANDIDNAAVEIASQLEHSEKQSAKLRQLQELLKSIGAA